MLFGGVFWGGGGVLPGVFLLTRQMLQPHGRSQDNAVLCTLRVIHH
jgi:hypothetical protein